VWALNAPEATPQRMTVRDGWERPCRPVHIRWNRWTSPEETKSCIALCVRIQRTRGHSRLSDLDMVAIWIAHVASQFRCMDFNAWAAAAQVPHLARFPPSQSRLSDEGFSGDWLALYEPFGSARPFERLLSKTSSPQQARSQHTVRDVADSRTKPNYYVSSRRCDAGSGTEKESHHWQTSNWQSLHSDQHDRN
jgi:hypothetical protein